MKLVVVSLKTPKAFANFSPGLERSDTLGQPAHNLSTLKGLMSQYVTLSALGPLSYSDPRVVAALHPGLN